MESNFSFSEDVILTFKDNANNLVWKLKSKQNSKVNICFFGNFPREMFEVENFRLIKCFVEHYLNA